jgi:hypothetical protein
MEYVTHVSNIPLQFDRSTQYQQIMACPFSRAWTLLVILHFITQITLQVVTLRDNLQARDKTNLCLTLAQVPVGVPLLVGDELTLCDGIPGHHDVTCRLIASGKNSTPFTRGDINVQALTDFDLDQIMNITIAGSEHLITGRCAVSLQYMYDA